MVQAVRLVETKGSLPSAASYTQKLSHRRQHRLGQQQKCHRCPEALVQGLYPEASAVPQQHRHSIRRTETGAEGQPSVTMEQSRHQSRQCISAGVKQRTSPGHIHTEAQGCARHAPRQGPAAETRSHNHYQSRRTPHGQRAHDLDPGRSQQKTGTQHRHADASARLPRLGSYFLTG